MEKPESNNIKLKGFIEHTGINVDSSSMISSKVFRFQTVLGDRGRDFQTNKSQDRSKMVKSELDTRSIGLKSFDVGLVPSLKSRAVKKELLRFQSLNIEDPYDYNGGDGMKISLFSQARNSQQIPSSKIDGANKFLPRIESKQSVDVKTNKLFDRTAGNSPHDGNLKLASFYSSKKDRSKKTSVNNSISFDVQDDPVLKTIDLPPHTTKLRDLQHSF